MSDIPVHNSGSGRPNFPPRINTILDTTTAAAINQRQREQAPAAPVKAPKMPKLGR